MPTPKQMAAQSRRNIDHAIKSLRSIALRYDDVDQYIVGAADRHAETLEGFAREIDEITADCLTEAED
ncbi:hypothetical protein [Magnetospirillum sp. XM-1]|uniref:hypothetical protein n=1 Tax=Magnetospirillum sp. XM-1 TaxID=1663591 RepID=UPI0012E3B0B7|nr:hypothetical protein [Magnetospirillum sp. XM-1]